MKILLVGNPNVGKSVLFNRLTSTYVMASNYPGATVEFTQGKMVLPNGSKATVIDVPGTYTLDATNKAEEVAVKMLADINDKDIVLNVIDSTNIERSLNLTMQLIKGKFRMICAMNMADEAKHVGVDIHDAKLSEELGIPAISISAITGEGIKNLVDNIENAKVSKLEIPEGDIWNKIGEITDMAVTLKHKHHSAIDRFSDLTSNPITGLPIALMVLATAFAIIRYVGEGLIGYVLDPLFETFWLPVLYRLNSIIPAGPLTDILIGKPINGEIDFVQSLGMLSTGLYVPLGMVLPYVMIFYFVLSFLEDSGYLPRLGVLLDTFFHRIGLHGLSVIPMLLGLGCNVPGALSIRILETKRERFIASTLMAISIPCMAQIAMIFGLVGSQRGSFLSLTWIFGALIVVWLVLGFIMNKFVKGNSPEIFIEIPPYRIPYIRGLFKKMRMRLISFLTEAVPWVLGGVLAVNILYTFGVVDFLGNLFAPIVTNLMGLPGETVSAMMIGFFRKDVAVGMLAPLGLTAKQIVIASVVLSMYFPCIATFAVLIKELGLKLMAFSTLIMLSATVTVAVLLNLLPLAWF